MTRVPPVVLVRRGRAAVSPGEDRDPPSGDVGPSLGEDLAMALTSPAVTRSPIDGRMRGRR